MSERMKIEVDPDWGKIDPIREKARQFLTDSGLAISTIHALVMVLGELLENSVKYGSYESSDDQIKLEIGIEDNIITVAVTNPVDDGSIDDLHDLDRMIQWVRGHQDPFEAYTNRLREVAKKPLHDEASGLGIVRIAYEGDVVLDFFVNQDNLLTVSAVLTV